MAFPQVAALQGSGEASDVTTHDWAAPAGLVSGDLLLAVGAFYEGGEGRTVTFPASITPLFNQEAPNNTCVAIVGYRFCDGSEGATFDFTSSAGTVSAGILLRITGAHPSTPPEISAVVSGTATTVNPASLNPTGWDVEDTLWGVFGWHLRSATVSSYPTNYADNDHYQSSGASGVRAAIVTRELAAASEDPGVLTWSASVETGALTIAVRPAASAGTILPQMMQHYYNG